MKEMEKKGGNLVFLKEKALSFHTQACFNFSLFSHFQGLFKPYLKPLTTPHSSVCVCVCVCVCVLVDLQWIVSVQSTEITQLATWSSPKVVCQQIDSGQFQCRVQRSRNLRLGHPLRSQDGCEVYDCTLSQNPATWISQAVWVARWLPLGHEISI